MRDDLLKISAPLPLREIYRMIPLSVSVNTVLSEVWNIIGQDNDDKDNLMIIPSCKLLPYNQFDQQLTLLYQEKYILPPGIFQFILKALELTIKNPFWHPRGKTRWYFFQLLILHVLVLCLNFKTLNISSICSDKKIFMWDIQYHHWCEL
jgi:hypothetical protein